MEALIRGIEYHFGNSDNWDGKLPEGNLRGAIVHAPARASLVSFRRQFPPSPDSSWHRWFCYLSLSESSAELRKLNCKGELPWTCTMVSPHAIAKWCMLGSRKPKPAAMKAVILFALKTSPIPSLNVPEMTVTFSRRG